MNVISQRFVVEQSMSLLNVNLLRFIWMNDQSVYYYDIYKMCYQLRDSWNIEKKDISIFYAIDKKESFLILNISSMQFKYIQINMIARTWCFNVNEHAFKLFFTQAFAKVLQDEFTVYVLVMIRLTTRFICTKCWLQIFCKLCLSEELNNLININRAVTTLYSCIELTHSWKARQ